MRGAIGPVDNHAISLRSLEGESGYGAISIKKELKGERKEIEGRRSRSEGKKRREERKEKREDENGGRGRDGWHRKEVLSRNKLVKGR